MTDAALVAAKAMLGRHPLPPADRLAPHVDLHAGAPVGAHRGSAAYAEVLTRPLCSATAAAVWEPDLILGGVAACTGVEERWVATHGHLVGRLQGPLWGVPAPSTAASTLRVGAFHRIVGEGDAWAVAETRILFDLLALASQTGIEVLPPFDGRAGRPPAPARGPAVAPELGEPTASHTTLTLVEDMLGGCNRLVNGSLQSMGMATYWHDDMRWYGPHGVGATHGFDEFQRDAQGPSVASFPNRRGGHHRARFADGDLAAFTGWPSLRGTFDGVAFRGIEPTGGPIGQNIMDFYVRRDTHLHENWVLIDLIDFAAQCGVDLLEGLVA